MRIYDPRIGRFLSEDPLTKSYPMLTPYQFASNRPIDGIDQDGLEYSPAGKDDGVGVPRDATAVKLYPIHPGTLQEQVREAPQRAAEAERARMFSLPTSGHSASISVMPQLSRYESQERKVRSEQAFRDAGWNADGSEGMLNALAKNKTFKRFSENLAMPMVEMAIGEGAGKLFAGFFKPKFTVDPKKFDYFFGRVTTGSEHNITRSADNLRALTTLGVTTDRQLMSLFGEALKSGSVQSIKSNTFGTTVTTSLEVNKRGLINVSFFYEGGAFNTIPKVTPLIPKIYKTP